MKYFMCLLVLTSFLAAFFLQPFIKFVFSKLYCFQIHKYKLDWRTQLYIKLETALSTALFSRAHSRRKEPFQTAALEYKGDFPNKCRIPAFKLVPGIAACWHVSNAFSVTENSELSTKIKMLRLLLIISNFKWKKLLYLFLNIYLTLKQTL